MELLDYIYTFTALAVALLCCIISFRRKPYERNETRLDGWYKLNEKDLKHFKETTQETGINLENERSYYQWKDFLLTNDEWEPVENYLEKVN